MKIFLSLLITLSLLGFHIAAQEAPSDTMIHEAVADVTDQQKTQTDSMDATIQIMEVHQPDPVAKIIALGDSLKEVWDHSGAADAYLKALELDSANYEAAWKSGREITEVANQLSPKMKDEKEIKFTKAVALCEQAIALNESGWEGHFHLSVALGRLALFRGGKKKINMSKRIKAEADTAIILNPEADLAYHVVGRWHQNLANLGGFLKFFAKVLYGGVPPGSNEESAVAFKRAIEIDPNHIEHHLELARTYKYMGEKELAQQSLQTVLELPNIDEDDPQFKEEAKELLKKIK